LKPLSPSRLPATPSVAGIVLAAGSSTRMGRNKLLLDLGGETVVRRAVRSALEARLDPMIAVLGHDAERVSAELDGLACRTVLNLDHAKGVGTSIRAGARAAAGAPALIVILADMPLVTASMFETLVERYRASGAPIVASRYGDVEAPPNLFDRSLFAELVATDDERGARPVIRRHECNAVFVSWPKESLRDLDVAEDYEKIRAQLSGTPGRSSETGSR
jgi:molybdenum cofactor cytidylyltransferase